MENNIVEKMKPLQILYNLDKCGINVNEILGRMNLEKEYYIEWLGRIYDNNKTLFENRTKEEFINYTLYGK